ncbi:MAG: histidine kinase dimerization/phosphoacceptor domain -containing protein [Cyclobacteriaceae bacterium]
MRLLSILMLFVCSHWATSQNDQNLAKHFECGNTLLNQQIDSAINCINKAIYLSKELGNKDKLAGAYELKALWFYKRSSYDTSLLFYDSAFVIYKNSGDEKRISNLFSSKALVLEKKGLVEEAIEYFQMSVSLAEKNKDNYQAARSNSNIANLYVRLKAYEEAIKRYRSSLFFFSNSDAVLPSDLAGTYLALGTTFKNLDHFDSSRYYLKRASQVFEKESIPLGIAFAFNNLGNLFERQSLVDSAIYYYKLSISIKTEMGFRRGIPSSLKNLGSLLRKTGSISQAQNYLNEGFEMVLADKDSFLIRDFYYELAEIHADLRNQEKAIEFYQKFIELDGRISGQEKIAAISEVEGKYNKARDEQMITELKLEAARRFNERNQMLFAGGILILLIAFLLAQRIQRNKASRVLKIKNEAISTALFEKEILLKEIHHRVKNNLQTISSLLNLQSRYVGEEAKDAVTEGKNRVKTMALIHQKLYQSDNLKGIVFSEYLQGLVDILFRSYGVNQERIRLKTDIEPLNLDVDTAIPLGLILNELICNSLKYAFPNGQEGEIKITLKQTGQKLNMIMMDSGVGIPQGFDLKNAKSFGMKLIHTLAEKLEASIKIEHSEGTRILFEINKYQLAS